MKYHVGCVIVGYGAAALREADALVSFGFKNVVLVTERKAWSRIQMMVFPGKNRTEPSELNFFPTQLPNNSPSIITPRYLIAASTLPSMKYCWKQR